MTDEGDEKAGRALEVVRRYEVPVEIGQPE
jgi:hypothetical protein